MSLDKKDQSLLYYLENNCRESLSSIGRKIRVSKEVLTYRLHRLEEKGIIKRYEAIVNDFALGLQQYRILCSVKDPHAFLEIIRQKTHMLARTRKLSKWNIDIAVWAKSNAQFQTEFDELLQIEDSMANVSIMLITKRYSLLHSRIHGKQQVKELHTKIVNIDEKSRYLLSLLKIDARIPATELAKKLKISAVAVAKKIKQLQKNNIIIGTRVVIDTQKLQYAEYQIHMTCKHMNEKEKLRKMLLVYPHITGLRMLIGEFTIEVICEVVDPNEIAKFLSHIQTHVELKKFDIALL